MEAHDRYFRDVKSFYSVSGNLFKRRGAWFGLFVRANGYGMAKLHLATVHGAAFRAKEGSKLIELYPTHDGHRVPFVVQGEADELTLLTRYGNVRFTFGSETLLMAEGDKGMGLAFEKSMEMHETVKPRKDGAWEAAFRWSCSILFKGVNGSGFSFGEYWHWPQLSSGEIQGSTTPDAGGGFTLVMEEFTHAAMLHDDYPSYAAAKADMCADWERFYHAMPEFIEPYEQGRAQATYTLWSYLLSPTPGIAHNMIMMLAPSEVASQWQMCQNAVALEPHLPLSIDLLLSPLDRVSPYGQFSDLYNDATTVTQMIKPPVHGWALKRIMARRDLRVDLPREQLLTLYTAVGRWGNWFLTMRDEDGDGLPAYEHGDETGFDDSTLFREHMQLATPDLSAYLVLLYEAEADLARMLDRPDEAAEWQEKSRKMLDAMLRLQWDGEHFCAVVPYTGERVYSLSLLHYIPAVLGDRLPKEILDKLCEDLTREGEFLTEFGLATERLDSDWLEATGMSICRGNIVPPGMVYICSGLLDSSRRDAGKRITERYCTALLKQGMPFVIHPLFGAAARNGGTWPACVYTILCRMLSDIREE